MDILSLDVKKAASAGAWVHLKHPGTGLPVGIRFKVLGADSDVYKALVETIQKDALERVKNGAPQTDTKDRAADLLAACTTEWDWGDNTLDGAVPAFSEPEARRIYQHAGLVWVREQIDAAVHNRGVFLAP